PRLHDLAHRDAWVLRTAINVALRTNRRGRPSARMGAAGDSGMEDEAVNRLVVAEAVRSLSRRQRDAVTLRYLCDLSEAEAAAALDVSVGALKSHLHRARRSLRAALGAGTAKELLDAD
ncbi:MAG: sigma factor-like helix-turn-helix DNA-binding protein, partial [Acidimicrobiales bacterium]